MQPPYKRRYKSYFTRSEIAQLFEAAPNTANRWVRGGKLPSVVSPGGRRRYLVDAVLGLIPLPMQEVYTPLLEVRARHGSRVRHVRRRDA